jgi:hypothetical protein
MKALESSSLGRRFLSKLQEALLPFTPYHMSFREQKKKKNRQLHKNKNRKNKRAPPKKRKEKFLKQGFPQELVRKEGRGRKNKNLHSYWRLKKKKLAERKSIDAPKDYERKRKLPRCYLVFGYGSVTLYGAFFHTLHLTS